MPPVPEEEGEWDDGDGDGYSATEPANRPPGGIEVELDEDGVGVPEREAAEETS